MAMKRALIILVVIAGLVAVGAILYSTENVKPTESELSKYPELSPFLAGRTGFRGVRFNLDTNFYSFSFPTSLHTAEGYFEAIEADVKNAGWQLVSSEKQRQVYSRKKDGSAEMQQFEKVTLVYNSEKKEVTLTREDSDNDKESGSK